MLRCFKLWKLECKAFLLNLRSECQNSVKKFQTSLMPLPSCRLFPWKFLMILQTPLKGSFRKCDGRNTRRWKKVLKNVLVFTLTMPLMTKGLKRTYLKNGAKVNHWFSKQCHLTWKFGQFMPYCKAKKNYQKIQQNLRPEN